MTKAGQKRTGITLLILNLVVLVIALILFVLANRDRAAMAKNAEEIANEPAKPVVKETTANPSEEVTELRRKLQAAMNEVASLKAAMTSQVEERAIENGISELTGREAAAWGEALLLGVDIEAKGVTVDYNLGKGYSFDGTHLTFGNTTVKLSYVAPDNKSPGAWSLDTESAQ